MSDKDNNGGNDNGNGGNPTFSEADFNKFCDEQSNKEDIKQLMNTVTMLMQQNMQLLNMLQDGRGGEQAAPTATPEVKSEITNFNIMPDPSKIIDHFDGEKGPAAATVWLRQLETSAVLYGWPEPLIYQMACTSLRGAAKFWLNGKSQEINDWREFKAAFQKTFVFSNSKTELWNRMQARVQQMKENVSTYFYEKIALCKLLDLDFKEIREQVIIGLWSKELGRFLMSKHHVDEDSLFQDIVTFERVEEARKKRVNIAGQEKKSSRIVRTEKEEINTSKQTYIGRCFNCNLTGHRAAECKRPLREKGSCYYCGSMQHRVSDCPKRSSRQERTDSSQRQEDSTNLVEEKADPSYGEAPNVPSYQVEIQLKIKKDKISINPILGTGSPISLIIENLIPVDCINRNKIYQNYQGINNSKLNIVGSFATTATVCETDVDVLFYVVPEGTMNYKCLLGRDFIANDKFKFVFGDTVSIQNRETVDIQGESINIQSINLIADVNEIEVDVNPDINSQDRVLLVRNLYDKYLNSEKPPKPKVDFEVKINVKSGQAPFFYRPRRLSFYEKNEVNKIINDLLSKNIIRESKSEYSSPIVLVKKETEGLRMCVDFRDLNKITAGDNYPLPLIDDQIER